MPWRGMPFRANTWRAYAWRANAWRAYALSWSLVDMSPQAYRYGIM